MLLRHYYITLRCLLAISLFLIDISLSPFHDTIFAFATLTLRHYSYAIISLLIIDADAAMPPFHYAACHYFAIFAFISPLLFYFDAIDIRY
jgi:hypothetical protein